MPLCSSGSINWASLRRTTSSRSSVLASCASAHVFPSGDSDLALAAGVDERVARREPARRGHRLERLRRTDRPDRVVLGEKLDRFELERIDELADVGVVAREELAAELRHIREMSARDAADLVADACPGADDRDAVHV